MSLVFFFLRNVPISGLCLPKVGEGEEGEEREEEDEEADNAGGGSPLSVGSKKHKNTKSYTVLVYMRQEQHKIYCTDICSRIALGSRDRRFGLKLVCGNCPISRVFDLGKSDFLGDSKCSNFYSIGIKYF